MRQILTHSEITQITEFKHIKIKVKFKKKNRLKHAHAHRHI